MKQTLLTLIVLGLIGAALFWAAELFARYELRQDAQRLSRPRVIGTRPVDGELSAPPNTPIQVDLFLPRTGRGVDPATLDDASVRLVRGATGESVPAQRTAAADGTSLSVTPLLALVAAEEYRLEITDKLRDEAGEAFIPFTARFRVAPRGSAGTAAGGFPAAYEQVPLTESLAPSMFTVLALGPSPDDPAARDLFAGTADGRIIRYALSSDGTLRERAVLLGVSQNNEGPRLVTGLAFDPQDPQVLWISHGVAALSGAPDFTGTLSTLSGQSFSTYADRVVGLPRAYKDHLNFGIAFSDDGALYLSQGSNTSAGSPDAKWNNRPERLLGAAILKIDTARLPADAPLDVRTADGGGSYDPFAAGAPLKLHATGVRSGFSLLWHSSGRLFTAINGAGRGGNAPAVADSAGQVRDGPLMSVEVTTDDTLADVTRAGTYHGHPNIARGERVLMGGNPTPRPDPYELSSYSEGTAPERHFALPAWNFGKGYSPNGLAESRAPVFGGGLAGSLFVCRFSAGDDVLILRINRRGEIFEAISGVEGLTNLRSPLAIVENPATGNLYVSEFDAQRLMLLRPIKNGQSPNARRQGR